ncbi:MAG TPA: FKBP-type peptidyl-prolyl cis-trans isomerase [Flavisolibacter sp.]|jgi:FKBP-type peptidyl-prolyl cis-trans isomerase FklB|nr:FKBP-type peptidyl-prolyl cis-trans isomerase [Flavisolibacter sp.]
MKNLLVAVLLLAAVQVQAQKTLPKKTPPKKTGTSASKPFKNLTDSASYAIGLSVANFYKQQGFKNLNTSLIAKAISDVQVKGGKPLMNEAQANECIMFYINPKLRETITAGTTFLAGNKAKPGIKTTASGLQYEVLTQGTGPRPAVTDTVLVHYTGSLPGGNVFESSVTSGKPVEFPLNRVIKGWTEGLQLMTQGSKYKFYIPYELAYGVNDQGPIPGGSALIFEVELLTVKPAAKG